MEKEDLKAGTKVNYPETVFGPKGVGIIDKDGKGDLIFGKKDPKEVFVQVSWGGSLFFPISSLVKAE